MDDDYREDNDPFGGKTPEEACREFLGEMGTSVHLMQQDFHTTILTTLDRDDLIGYLRNVIKELKKGLGVRHNRDNTDIVHIEEEQTPSGERRIAAILQLEVSPQ